MAKEIITEIGTFSHNVECPTRPKKPYLKSYPTSIEALQYAKDLEVYEELYKTYSIKYNHKFWKNFRDFQFGIRI